MAGRKTPTIFGVGWWAHVKCKTHPYHPKSTFLGFTAALAPKVSGASLSLGLESIILPVRFGRHCQPWSTLGRPGQDKQTLCLQAMGTSKGQGRAVQTIKGKK